MKYSIDTRTLNPGDIFIPIKGPNFDGHDFIEEALHRGASQILDVDLGTFARTHRLRHTIPVIAITGSSGKTSTKDLLHAVLSVKYKVIKTRENQNNEFGVPLTLLNIDSNTDMAIVEMGMRGRGEIAHLASIALPTHSIITNIGYTHLERLGSRRHIALAKREIFTSFPNSPPNKHAFFPKNIACPQTIRSMAQQNGFILHEVATTNLIYSNEALVTQVAQHFGLSESQIRRGLAQYQPSTNRQDRISIGEITLINDTYNANPESMVFALELLGKQPGRKIAVLGDMLELGQKTALFHQNLSRPLMNNNVSLLLTIGDLSKHINPPIPVVHYDNKTELTQQLIDLLKPGDTVLFKASRGVRLEDVVQSVKKNLTQLTSTQ